MCVCECVCVYICVCVVCVCVCKGHTVGKGCVSMCVRVCM